MWFSARFGGWLLLPQRIFETYFEAISASRKCPQYCRIRGKTPQEI